MGFLFVAGYGLSAADRPVPVSVQAKPGRFEVSALDASAAHALVSASEDAWRMLAGPLGLPDAFSSPIFVRVSPWTEGEVEDLFHALVEPGGIVSLRVMTGPAVSRASRRAVVRMALRSLPAPGSLMAIAKITSPVAQRGNHCCFCAGVPKREI